MLITHFNSNQSSLSFFAWIFLIKIDILTIVTINCLHRANEHFPLVCTYISMMQSDNQPTHQLSFTTSRHPSMSPLRERERDLIICSLIGKTECAFLFFQRKYKRANTDEHIRSYLSHIFFFSCQFINNIPY